MREALPAKRRKDAVLAVEYLMTASPDWWEKATNAEHLQFFNQAHKWLASKYGAQNVFVATIHKDETSPHLSAFVVPLTKEGRLSAKEFIGNRTQMSADQTSFAEAVRHLGLERGVEGSKARHTSIADYYRRVGSQAPQTPAIDVPEPSVVDRLKPADYGQKVADSVLAQIGPEWNAIKANRKQQAEKAAQKQQRIEALPGLARNTQHGGCRAHVHGPRPAGHPAGRWRCLQGAMDLCRGGCNPRGDQQERAKPGGRDQGHLQAVAHTSQ